MADSSSVVLENQAKYGAIPIGDIQPAYGVIVNPPIQAKYGPISTTGDINISYQQLEENIATLKSAIQQLKDSWNTETKNNINKIKNSWAGEDCKAYIDRLNTMDMSVQRSISALELLCNTYEKARNMISDTVKKSSSAINNIN